MEKLPVLSNAVRSFIKRQNAQINAEKLLTLKIKVNDIYDLVAKQRNFESGTSKFKVNEIDSFADV